MAKDGQSHMVTISNVWGVDEYNAQYGVRFRNDKSATGWAKAFIPKTSNVHMTASVRNYKMKTFIIHESTKVDVRFHDDETHYHTEEMPVRDFKVLYNESRKLVKADKERIAQEHGATTPASEVSAREVPETSPLPWDDVFDADLPFE